MKEVSTSITQTPVSPRTWSNWKAADMQGRDLVQPRWRELFGNVSSDDTPFQVFTLGKLSFVDAQGRSR